MSKLFPLEHLNCVVAGRGLAHTLLYVGSLAHSAISLDALCAAIPGSMAWAASERRKHHPDIDSPMLLEQEDATAIAVVAWDGERLVAKIWNGYESADPAHAVIDLDQVRTRSYFGPDIQVDAPQLLSDAQMLALARRQVLETRQKLGPDARIGGRLIGARVTERGISMRTLGEIYDPR